jgi:low affinity Fe/Cu permease
MPKKSAASPAQSDWHMPYSQEWFGRVARHMAVASGKPITFLTAVLIVIAWAVLGPAFGYSDTWQLVINTGTTIITFLMVFLIQNTQNRDTMAIQLKLAELILTMRGAENRLAVAEEMTDEELEELHESCRRRSELALESLTARRAGRAQAAPAEGKDNGKNAKDDGKNHTQHHKSAKASA